MSGDEVEIKNYMKNEKKKSIEELASNIDKDKESINDQQRFGFFSIPYASHIGDKHYSQAKPSRLNDDKKVITSPRGIFTKPGKKGKNNDAFFNDMVSQEKDTLNRIMELNEEEKVAFKKRVEARKKANQPTDVRPTFKPTSPHEYVDYYEQKKINYDVPITKTIDKKLKIDKEKKSVFTEKRGIFTNPPKKGQSTTPGILFSYNQNDHKKPEGKESPNLRSRSAEKKDDRFAFKPSSLAIDQPFCSDKELFGEDEKEINKLVERSLDIKKAGKPRYKNILPKGAAEHMNKFKPNQFEKSGKEALFNLVTGIPFSPFISKTRKHPHGEKPEFKKPFTYNKLDQISLFSPPISSFVGNLKKEFPKVFRK